MTTQLDLLIVGDGASIHTRRHAEAIAQIRGLRVGLAAFEGDPIDGVEMWSLGDRGPESDRRYPLAVPGLAGIIRKVRPRTIHAHYVSSYGLLAASALRIAHPVGPRPPLVQSAWGTDLLVTAKSNAAWTVATTLALRSATLITTDSVDLDTEAKLLAPRTARIRFAWGPPEALFDRPRAGLKQMVAARSLQPNMRVDLIVRAFREARTLDDRLADWRLIVVGDGPEEDRIKAAAGADDAVEFRGRLRVEVLHELLASSLVFVNVPSTDATSAVLLESLALGMIPVVNDLEAYREWIDPGIGEVVSQDPSQGELARALIRATQRTSESERIRDRVRATTWEAQVGALVSAYVSICGWPDGPPRLT